MPGGIYRVKAVEEFAYLRLGQGRSMVREYGFSGYRQRNTQIPVAILDRVGDNIAEDPG